MQIIVTGVGSANTLGYHIAKELEESGHMVIAVDKGSSDFMHAVQGIDVGSPSSIAELRQIITDYRARPDFNDLSVFYADENGFHVDGIINCAGVNSNDWFADVTPEELERVMLTNAFSIPFMVKEFLPELTNSAGAGEGGFVINIVSNAAHIPMTSSLAYNMSKAAALMATKQLSHELSKTNGLTIFSVSPNKLRGTEMSRQIEENVCRTRGWTPEYAAQYQRNALVHGIETDPKSVANLIAYFIDSGHFKTMGGTDVPVGK